MLDRSRTIDPESASARVLPKDDKVRIVIVDCQRALDLAIEELQRFRELWFVEDPPKLAEAREVILRLLEEPARIRNALFELRRITEPI
jgi:hypothetical protein